MENYETMFVNKYANVWMYEAGQQPVPEPLWKSLWFRNELACLFADTNMGKSILAVQIANDIAERGEPVLYFDFEMSAKQFQMRYTDPEDGKMMQFAAWLCRVELSDEVDDMSLNTILLAIEREVERTNAKVIVIDNITWLCNYTESGDTAGELMLMLTALKRRLGLSILVLAHTPKRPSTSALTQNSLAGSKKLANFMDSMFAIGTDHTDTPAGRYIKQIKVRSSELEYGADSVIRARLVKQGNRLFFEELGLATEQSLLACNDGATDNESRREQIMELRKQGLSKDEICKQLRMSKSTLYKLTGNDDN